MSEGTGVRMIRLELKYCERCGGLLLRKVNEAVVYCSPCERSLSEMPAVKGKSQKKNSSANVEEMGLAIPRKQPQSVRIEAAQERRIG